MAKQLTLGHEDLVGYRIGWRYWVFARARFKPSYWLILKREGFSGDLLTASDELDDVTKYLNREELATIYSLEQRPVPDYFWTNSVRTELEEIVLSSRIQVFNVSQETVKRLANPNDPIYSNPSTLQCTSDPTTDFRNQLAEELGQDISARWLGKDQADKLHWDRSALRRELYESYDVGKAVVDTVVDVVKGLWDIAKLVITVAGKVVEITFDAALATAEYHRKLITGEIKPEDIKRDLEALGIAIGDAVNDAKALMAKAKEGFELFQRVLNDPESRQLIIDFLDSLYQSIHYRDTRTIGVKVVTIVGIEVLLAFATMGAGNVARRVGQATQVAVASATAARTATRIGPFTRQAIEKIVQLAKSLDRPGVKQEKTPISVVPENGAKNPKGDGPNSGKVAARTAAQDREEISRLSKEAAEARKRGDEAIAVQKIEEARDILRPHIPKAPDSDWSPVIDRLDVSTQKDGAVFWSGDQATAQRYAESIGGSTLEATPGGNVINGWDSVNDLPWGDKQGPPPWAGDLWNGVSKKFANGATGKVSVVQPTQKLWDQGTVWHNTEKEIINKSIARGKVTSVDIFTLDGNNSPVKLSTNYVNDLMKLQGIPR
jgi:hypothetical protein